MKVFCTYLFISFSSKISLKFSCFFNHQLVCGRICSQTMLSRSLAQNLATGLRHASAQPAARAAVGVQRLSAKEMIEREKRCGAHNYKPLPVVLERGQGQPVLGLEP